VISGNATQAQIARAFGLPLLRVKYYVKLYSEGGTAAFLIVQALESPAARQVKDPLPNWLAEIAFAAEYLLKGFDVIPDHRPDIGLADDARLLQRIIERNRLELHSALVECICVAAGDSRLKNLALD